MLVLLIRNLLVLALVLVTAPLRLFRSRARPEWVRFRIKGDPPYRVIQRRRWPFARRPEPGSVVSVWAVERHLAVLERDPRVKGIVLELEGWEVGPAKRAALARLFDRFRGKGKQIVGYAVTANNLEYELLCECDRVVMPPAGRLELLGFSAEATALAAGLSRAGVTAHFVRRGDHKTAPELFTHDRISEIQRKTLETMLDERYAELIKQLAKGRKLSDADARARVDEGPYSARRAVTK